MKSFFATLLAAAATAASNWSTGDNKLYYKGDAVVLHGFSITCTEYLLRGIGMVCFAEYDWNDASNIITSLNMPQIDGIIHYMNQLTNPGIKPAIRIPMTANYWLGQESNASKQNMDKYPKLGDQYQTMISKIVDEFTKNDIVSILDLHWNNDDNEQQAMALKSNTLDFWDSISSKFADNDHVFYELYNEPHVGDNTFAYMYGDDQFTGMLQMEETIRKNAEDAMLVIAGGKSYAYDSDTLVDLDKVLKNSNVLYNFHPYMGPDQ